MMSARRWTRWRQVLTRDWYSSRRLTWGAATVLLSALVTLAYYANQPGVLRDPDPDTRGYVAVAHAIVQRGQLVDPLRLPGYPLFMVGVFALAGSDNLAAVSVAQGLLFVLAAGELYVLLCLAGMPSWRAGVAAMLAGTNVHLLSYVYPPLTEGLALCQIVSLALVVTLFLRRPRVWTLWVIAALTLALFMTRPEWIYLPVPLFAYLLFIAWRRGALRRLLPHALVAVLALYGFLGLYVRANQAVTGCACLTSVQSINLLGKVMQYRMQDEAPPRYADMTRLVDSFLARGDDDPWNVIRANYPLLNRNFSALAGEYSTAIITAHPLEYLAKSLPLVAQLLTDTTPFRPLARQRAFWPLLLALDGLSRLAFVALLALFPLGALSWWWRLRRATADDHLLVETMAALALLAAYGLALSALGGYIYYPRLHTPYAPLLLAVGWGALLGLLPRRAGTRSVERRAAAPVISRRAGASYD